MKFTGCEQIPPILAIAVLRCIRSYKYSNLANDCGVSRQVVRNWFFDGSIPQKNKATVLKVLADSNITIPKKYTEKQLTI